MLGGLKQVAVDMHTYGVYCSHVELGYAKTFAEIVRTLAGSLQLEGAAAAPAYVEVQTLKLGEQPVGVATWTLEADEEGDLRSLLSNSMFVPAGDGAVTAQDSAHLQWMTPEGRCSTPCTCCRATTRHRRKLELRPAEESGVWQRQWHVHGQDRSQLDVGKEPPVSVLAQARLRRDLLAGPDPVGKTSRTTPGRPPTRPGCSHRRSR